MRQRASTHPRDGARQRHPWLHRRYLLALLGLGIICGITGAFFTVVLYGVEHLAFGFSSDTFAEAITSVTPLHRFAAVGCAGIAVAVIWYLLRRYGPHIPTQAEIYAGKRISPLWMAADTTLQVINVGAGGSIGREGAPRQLGALCGAKAAELLKLEPGLCRLLVACGTGAGLAAIYNVPIAGALFTLEIMIGFKALRGNMRLATAALLSALAVAWIATLVARIAVPDRPTYAVQWQALDAPLVLISLVLGILAGAAGHGFAALTDRVRKKAPQGKAILWTMPLCYLLLAAIAMPLPLVLGNGHAMAQDIFSHSVPLATAALLILAKPLATLLTVRAGATGGLLTPSMSTGAAIGIVAAALCSMLWPVPVAAVAIIGAAAFLAGSMSAPLTACALALEFTGAHPTLWPLALLAVGTTWLTTHGLNRISQRRTQRM